MTRPLVLDSSRVPPNPVTRFAPAPTGYLHLGHLVNAVFVWGMARRLDGRVVLRIEDHDRGRSRNEYESAIVEDLEWLGLVPDPQTIVDPPAWVRQSNRGERYEAVLDQLATRHPVYGCSCSRRDIAEEVDGASGEERRYPGTCRDRGIRVRQPDVGVRVGLEPGTEQFDDLLLGPLRQEPERQCGDLLVRDRVGRWTYQYAVTVDDWDQDVNLIIRGEDLLSSTGRQIRLARMMGRTEPPVFLHHPLVLKPTGEKLSKASCDTGLRELRAAGVPPEDLLGEAAARGGLLPSARPVSVSDLSELFS